MLEKERSWGIACNFQPAFSHKFGEGIVVVVFWVFLGFFVFFFFFFLFHVFLRTQIHKELVKKQSLSRQLLLHQKNHYLATTRKP